MDLGSLTEKKGPLPVWAWAIITAGVLYLGYRHFKGSSSSTATPTATTAADTTGATADTSQAALPTDTGTTGPLDLSGSSPTDLSPPNTGVDTSSIAPWWTDPSQWPTPDIPPLTSPSPTDPGGLAVSPEGQPISRPAPVLKSIIPSVTGTVKSQKVLPSGAKVVTLASGAKVEKAPGKTAYVIKKAPAKK